MKKILLSIVLLTTIVLSGCESQSGQVTYYNYESDGYLLIGCIDKSGDASVCQSTVELYTQEDTSAYIDAVIDEIEQRYEIVNAQQDARLDELEGDRTFEITLKYTYDNDDYVRVDYTKYKGVIELQYVTSDINGEYDRDEQDRVFGSESLFMEWWHNLILELGEEE